MGYAADKHLNKVQQIMNRAVRIISGNFEHDVRGVELSKQVGLMTLKERRDYHMDLLLYKCVHGIAPYYLCNVLTPASSIKQVKVGVAMKIYYTCHTSAVTFFQSL